MRKYASFALIAATTLLLNGCANSERASDAQQVPVTTGSDAASASSQSSVATATQASEKAEKVEPTVNVQGLTISQAYVAAKGTDKAMTPVFLTVTNTTDAPITIVAVEGNLPATYEIHEVVNGVMQKKEDGLTLAPQEETVLQPGGDHIMIMGYSEEIAAGDTVSLTLRDNEGTEYPLPEVPVRVQQATHEHYGSGGEGTSSSETAHPGQTH